jgi:hypothetical protein
VTSEDWAIDRDADRFSTLSRDAYFEAREEQHQATIRLLRHYLESFVEAVLERGDRHGAPMSDVLRHRELMGQTLDAAAERGAPPSHSRYGVPVDKAPCKR